MTAYHRLTIAMAVLCAGCMPHVMHGPRIEDDGVTGSVSLTHDLGDGTIYMPTIVWRDRDEAGSTAVNFSIGLGVPFGEDTRDTLIIAGLTFELGLRRH